MLEPFLKILETFELIKFPSGSGCLRLRHPYLHGNRMSFFWCIFTIPTASLRCAKPEHRRCGRRKPRASAANPRKSRVLYDAAFTSRHPRLSPRAVSRLRAFAMTFHENKIIRLISFPFYSPLLQVDPRMSEVVSHLSRCASISGSAADISR